jgi:hypothetical protein
MGEETQDTLQLVAGLSVDILMLDIVDIVVSAEDIITEVGVLECMGVHWMTVASRFELVKFVSCVWRVADESG